MNKQTQKQVKQERPKNEPQRLRGVMSGLVDNPDFILYNILKARKG